MAAEEDWDVDGHIFHCCWIVFTVDGADVALCATGVTLSLQSR